MYVYCVLCCARVLPGTCARPLHRHHHHHHQHPLTLFLFLTHAQVDIVTQVDAGILGGLQVMVGDRFLDLSVASRVATLSKSLEAAN